MIYGVGMYHLEFRIYTTTIIKYCRKLSFDLFGCPFMQCMSW